MRELISTFKKEEKRKKKSAGWERIVEHSPQILASEEKATSPPPTQLKQSRSDVARHSYVDPRSRANSMPRFQNFFHRGPDEKARSLGPEHTGTAALGRLELHVSQRVQVWNTALCKSHYTVRDRQLVCALEESSL